MDRIDGLIRDEKYEEAAKAIDAELAKKEDARLYYLRAMVSHRLKNYEYAHEMLEHALYIRKDADYFKLKGVMLFEQLEFEESFEALKETLDRRKDAEAYFLSAICLMFLDDPKSKDYLQLAYLSDKAKTKVLISTFYDSFFRNNMFLGEKDKKALAAKIAAIK